MYKLGNEKRINGRYCLRLLLMVVLALTLGIPLAAYDSGTSGTSDMELFFEGKSWEEIIEEFLASSPDRPENVGVAYYNTVTGEYHEYHGDRYYLAASMYKLPLNMYFAEKIYLGEMTMDDRIFGRRYGDVQKASLQFSSNPESESLMGYLGGMDEYLDAIYPYVADEGDDYDREEMRRIAFTPNQMLHALKLLYAEPERYPDILYYLGEANQDNFFCKYEDRFPIAHKYGWIVDNGLTVVNDAGIIGTDEPILLVFMSNFNSGDTVTIGQFCTLMCDYCQYWHSVHQREAEERSATEFIPEITQDTENEEETETSEAVGVVSEELPPDVEHERIVQATEKRTTYWLFPLPLLIAAAVIYLLRRKPMSKK